MTDVMILNHQTRAIALAEIADQARNYVAAAQADNTRRAYRSDWADFLAWCETHDLVSMPATPDTVALYLAALADRVKPATIQRRLSSISQAHQAAGHETPTKSAIVRKVWAGIRRTKGMAQTAKAPLLSEELRRLLSAAEQAEHPVMVARDRALLLIGFAGAFRRSELVTIAVEDVEHVNQGVILNVRRSKADQEGRGTKKAIPFGRDEHTCPVRALARWQDAAGVSSGPLFRAIDRHGNVGANGLSPQSVALVVKRLAAAAGLDPNRYAGHSLRAGLATQATIGGASERAVMEMTGHRSLQVARRYIRNVDLFRENAASLAGL